MKIAIVTGASSGLGMAFVRRLDALGGLDEIWGVARRGERMEALAAELRTPMRPLALDLTRLESVETAGSHERGGAGGGGAGQRRRVRQIRHLRRTHPPGDLWHDRPELPGCRRTHCRRAPLHGAGKPGAGDLLLRRLSAPARLQCLRRHQGISAPVQPRPALGGGAAGHPGDGGVPRVDQDRFHGRGQRYKNGRTVRSFPFAQRPETVARRALRNSRLLAVTTCGLPALVQRVASKFLPHCFIMACWEGLRRA